MCKGYKTAWDIAGECGSSDDKAEEYSFAVGVVNDTLRGLESAGIALNEQCDALGYTLINLLTDHYSQEHALVLFETLQSTLMQSYQAEPVTSPQGIPPISRH